MIEKLVSASRFPAKCYLLIDGSWKLSVAYKLLKEPNSCMVSARCGNLLGCKETRSNQQLVVHSLVRACAFRLGNRYDG